MEDKMKKLLFIIFLILAVPSCVFAATGISVDYPGKPGPLFNISNLAPGVSISKTVYITNNNSVSEKIGFKVTKNSSLTMLVDKLVLTVKEKPGDLVKYSGSLKSAFALGEIEIGNIPSGSKVSYDFNVEFSADAGNEYQGLTETIDLSIGFIGTSAPPSVPSGVVESINTYLGFKSRKNQPVQDDKSQEGVIAGATDSNIQSSDKERGSKEQDSGIAGDKTCPWAGAILLMLAIVLVCYGLFLERKEFKHKLPKLRHIMPAIFGFTALIIHYFLHQGYKPTWVCDWFWFFDLLLVSVAYIFYRTLIKGIEAEKKKIIGSI